MRYSKRESKGEKATVDTSTCSDMFIEIVAPKDAENRKVPLDTKVMYDDKGIKYEVASLIFGTSKRCAGRDVECSTSDSDCMYTRPLDSIAGPIEGKN